MTPKQKRKSRDATKQTAERTDKQTAVMTTNTELEEPSELLQRTNLAEYLRARKAIAAESSQQGLPTRPVLPAVLRVDETVASAMSRLSDMRVQVRRGLAARANQTSSAKRDTFPASSPAHNYDSELWNCPFLLVARSVVLAFSTALMRFRNLTCCFPSLAVRPARLDAHGQPAL